MKTPDPSVTRPARLLLPITITLLVLGGCDSSSFVDPALQDQMSTEVPVAGNDDTGNDVVTSDTDAQADTDSTGTENTDPDTNTTNPDSDNTDTGNMEPDTNSPNPDPDSTQDPQPNDYGSHNRPENTGDRIPANHVLAPLPNPPVTPAPDTDSEPVRAEPRTSTITSFFTVRDPIQDLDDTEDDLTDEDYALGPLPPVISTPPEVDPLTNSPPFFVNLKNREIFAGEQLDVVFDPDDPDGGLPGMFRGNLPRGASFIDNLNGTKSLRWVPLQPDVGIHEFTVTAIDPLFPLYRSAQTIRIKVKLPEDQQFIDNLPPGINQVWPHTVRVNDPVVIKLKVTDPNGFIPELQILNPPAGSTTTPDPHEPGMTILHFIPTTPGNIIITLKAIDAVDPELTLTKDVNIEVLPAEAFIRPGSRLRELATARDLLFGYAALASFYERADGALYTDIAAEEFNIVSTENSMKFDSVNPRPGKYRWAATDNLVKQAKIDGQMIHGHTLVWYTQLPSWVIRSDPADREMIMREFIDRVLARYGEDIPLWDVVNESLEDDGSYRKSVWYESMGASYIDIAFRQARQSAPDATLIYNDYDVAFDGPKADGMFALLQQLKDAGTPIDGVGFQSHVFADFDDFDEVVANFQKAAELDLDIYITELDVSMRDGQTLEQQAQVYEKFLSACLDQPRCKAFQTWGFTDQYSWRREFEPLFFDKRYQIKPAYLTMQQRLSEN